MNESEQSFERILHDVLVMRFDLLGPLDVENMSEATGQAVQIIIFYLVFILYQLLYKS